jgi:AcrR family transcriptional regulator
MATRDHNDGRRARALRQREESRQQLVHAALQVFARDGYEAATPVSIAEQAGLSRASFYHHFSGKADAFAAVVESTAAHLASLVQGIDLSPGALPADQQLTRYVRDVVAVLADNNDLTALLLVAAPRDPVLRPMVDGLFDHVRWMIRSALQDGQVAGLVRPLDAELTSHLLLGAVQGVIVGGLGERTVDEVATCIVQVCLGGVASDRLRQRVLGEAATANVRDKPRGVG